MIPKRKKFANDFDKARSSKQGEKQRGNDEFRGKAKSTLDDGKHPSKCKWFNLSIFVKFMLVLIVLASITKKGEIVTNMAPFRPFLVILVIV